MDVFIPGICIFRAVTQVAWFMDKPEIPFYYIFHSNTRLLLDLCSETGQSFHPGAA